MGRCADRCSRRTISSMTTLTAPRPLRRSPRLRPMTTSSRCATSAGPTAPPRCSRGVSSSCAAASCSASSAPTAPGRRRPSRSCRACDGPTAARCRSSASTRRPPATGCAGGSAASSRTPPCPTGCGCGEALDLFASLHPSPQPLDELADGVAADPPPAAALRRAVRRRAQRLFVALALVGPPRARVPRRAHPEPRPVGRRHTWDVVRRVRDAGTTVVLVTHDVEEAERLCDRIVILDRGEVVADGSPAAITAELGGTHGRPLHGRRPRRPSAP